MPRVQWDTSTLKASYDVDNSKLIVSPAPTCSTCEVAMPNIVRLTFDNFADDCDTCWDDTTYLVIIHEVAAAINGNSYDAEWSNTPPDSRCEWALSEAGSYGHADCYNRNESCDIEFLIETITYDTLWAQIAFFATEVTFDIRFIDSDAQFNALFTGALTYTSGQCSEIDGDTCAVNTVAGCGNQANRHPCPDSGEVTIDFIY